MHLRVFKKRSSSVAGQFRATKVLKIGFQLNQRLLTKVALWRAQYDESCKLCLGGSYCLSLAFMVESVREVVIFHFSWKMQFVLSLPYNYTVFAEVLTYYLKSKTLINLYTYPPSLMQAVHKFLYIHLKKLWCVQNVIK
jgi:hypothetical protein